MRSTGSTASGASVIPAPHEHCHDLVCNGTRWLPRGTKGTGCSCRGRERRDLDELVRLRAEIDAAWFSILHGWDIEDREYFEREAPGNGFKYALAQAVHHMWKRRLSEQALSEPPSTNAIDPVDGSDHGLTTRAANSSSSSSETGVGEAPHLHPEKLEEENQHDELARRDMRGEAISSSPPRPPTKGVPLKMSKENATSSPLGDDAA